MVEKKEEELTQDQSIDNSSSSERKKRLKFKDLLKTINFIGYRKKQKLLIKYGDLIEDIINKIEGEKKLGRFIKDGLGSYFHKIRGAWDQYKKAEIDKTGLISSGCLVLGKKFVDIFIHESRDVLRARKRNVYLTLTTVFASLFTLCMFYFTLLMPIDITGKPEGNFIIFPVNEKLEWIFTMIMSLIIVISFGYLASLILPRLTVRIYTKSMKKNQKFGLVATENLFGSALYRKLLGRAIVMGFLAFNLAFNLASQKIFVTWMRSVNPEGIDVIPDPELMIQIIWIVSIPCILIIVPIWLMMDIGLARTSKVSGVEFESVDLTGSKFYKFIKGYAGIGFAYNLVLIIFVWATDDVPPMRVMMRVLSPIIVISFMLPLVVLIEYNNEHFKRKLLLKLEKFEISKRINVTIEVEQIKSYEELLEF